MPRSEAAPRVVVVTQIPSPYQVALFDALDASGAMALTALYERKSSPGRSWEPPAMRHAHRFLDAGEADAAMALAQDADLLVVSGYRNPALRALMARREAAGRPWAFWAEPFGFKTPPALGKFYRRAALATLRRSRAPMWGIGSMAVRSFRREFGEDRAYRVVPYASDLGAFLTIPRETPPAPARLLFSGSLIPRKGFDLLLDGLETLWTEGSAIRLTVVGDGPLRTRLDAARTRFPDRIDWLGFRQMRELPAIYAGADVLCAPSLHDGWGLIVVEGLAAGMPVLSTPQTGAAVELIDQTCGWMARGGDGAALLDALRAVAATPADRLRAMGEAGRKRARRFDLAAGATRFQDAARAALADAETRA